MLHTRDAISFRGGRRVFHSAVLAVLTMAAMLLCLLAVHSAGTGHAQGHGPGHSLSAASTGTAAPAMASGMASGATTAATALTAGAHSAVAHTASSATAAGVVLAGAVSSAVSSAGAGAHAASDLAALSMTCTLLMVLGSLILLSRRPSAFRRLFEPGGFVVGSFREIPLHLHRPSLTLLSISRI